MSENKSSVFRYTAGELIEILKEYPMDMPVLVNGYETGYENFHHPIVQKVIYLPENKYWDGEFQLDESGIDAIILEREVRDD